MTTKTMTNIPYVLQCWRDISAALPPMNLPIGPKGTPVNFSITLGTAVVLGCLNLAIRRLLIRSGGFPDGTSSSESENEEDDIKATLLVTASSVGIVHSTTLLISLGYLFASHDSRPSTKLSDAPQWWQEACHAVLQFCTGYMFYDSLAILFNNPSESDLLFIVHHVITMAYMTSTRVVGAGHGSAMIAMFVGEFTNPFHNGYYITQTTLTLECCEHGLWIQNLDHVNTFLFALTYCIFRILICPAFAIYIFYDTIFNGRKHIPLAVSLAWSALIFAILYGSIPWVYDCWNMLTTYLPELPPLPQSQVASPEL